MIIIRPRQGIGFDIEYSEDVIHRVHTEEGDELLAYNGAIIRLPFILIYWGDFFDMDDIDDQDYCHP